MKHRTRTHARIISVILTLAMVLSLLPMAAFAAGETYTKIAAADIAVGDEIVIVGKNGNEYYALTNDTNQKTEVTVSGNTLTISGSADKLIWTVGTATGKQVDGNNELKFVFANSDNYFARVSGTNVVEFESGAAANTKYFGHVAANGTIGNYSGQGTYYGLAYTNDQFEYITGGAGTDRNISFYKVTETTGGGDQGGGETPTPPADEPDKVTGNTFTKVDTLVDGQYVIVSNGKAIDLDKANTYHTNSYGTAYQYDGFNGTEVGIVDDMITSDVYEDMIWEVKAVSGGYTIQSIFEDEHYLCGSYASNYGNLYVDKNAATWTYQNNNLTTGGKSIANGDERFSFFTMRSSGSDITFYKVENESVAPPAPTTYTITANAGANGIISPSGSVTVTAGESKTFTVTPNNGYVVDTVEVNGESVTLTDGEYTFSNVSANATIAATFKAQPSVGPVSTDSHIGFTSDVHNNINNLENWLTGVQNALNPDLEYMVYGGDYCQSGSSNISHYNSVVSTTESKVGANKGIYTSGNHEYEKNQNTTLDYTFSKMTRIGEAADEDNYNIYCMGAAGWYDGIGTYPESDIETLEAYLQSAPKDEPIFIIAHFPLHYYNSGWVNRTITNADKVIDLLNGYPNVIFLWGHNHSQGDSHYGEILEDGASISYASGQSKVIQFTYASAGAMNGDRSPYYGVVATVSQDGEDVTLTYYGANGTAGKSEKIEMNGTAVENPGQENPPSSGDGTTPKGAFMIRSGNNVLTTRVGTGYTNTGSSNSQKYNYSGFEGTTYTSSMTITNDLLWVSEDAGSGWFYLKNVASGQYLNGSYTSNSTGGYDGALTVGERNDKWTWDGKLLKSYNASSGHTTGDKFLTYGNSSGNAASIFSVRSESNAADITFDVKNASGDTTTAVTGVTLNKTSTTLAVGASETLTATVAPDNATNKNVTWTSSNNNVATVNDGVVTAVAAGTATITVTTEDGGKTATCRVTVNPVAVTGVTLNKTTTTLLVGATESLTATVAPEIATNKNVTWSSSNTAVATVSNGVVTGVSVGTATITVTTEDGSKTAECTITVTYAPATSITISGNNSLVVGGATSQLTATVAPAGANQAVTWSSGSTSVATVNATTGVVTAVAPGTAVITATSAADSTVKATYTVTVTAAPILVTGVTLNETTLTLAIGATATLIPTIAPADATNQNVTWSTNADTIATVDSTGKVTAVKEGTATITVTTEDGGKTATCTVTVVKAIPVAGVTLNKSAVELLVGASQTLTASVAPAEATNKNLTWASTDSTVATVDATGKITALKAGYALISVTTEDGSFTDTCLVAVTGILNNPFVDVKSSDYFYNPVLWAVQNGITTGTSAITFSPDATCTRAQTVTFLWRAAGSPDPQSYTNPFSDVKASDYYYKAVLWAVENGITKGTSATTFSPDATVTRGQTVTFLWRAENEPNVFGVNPFTDVKSGAFYYTAVMWAVQNEITNGVTATTFGPDSGCTRGQIVTFLYRDLAE